MLFGGVCCVCYGVSLLVGEMRVSWLVRSEGLWIEKNITIIFGKKLPVETIIGVFLRRVRRVAQSASTMCESKESMI